MMNYQLATSLAISTEIIVLGLCDQKTLSASESLPADLAAELQSLVARQAICLKLAQVQVIYRTCAPYKVILVGLGDGQKTTVQFWQKVASAVGKALVDSNHQAVAWLFGQALSMPTWLRAIVIALDGERYQQGQLKQVPSVAYAWPKVITLVGAWEQEASTYLNEGVAISSGMHLTRTLGDLPANHCTPRLLANRAVELAASSQGRLKVNILDEADIAALGMGCLLGVAQGSVEPPRFIVMEYAGGMSDSAPVVLVGKGVTFDSGGIDIKSAARMDEMKYDMCGAAAIFGVMTALLAIDAKVHVCGLIAATENMPSGSALKPGDVITSMAGLTVEIMNTDAEGRLILADALAYAARYQPKAVIDIATLTGAMIITLGAGASGLMANNEVLAQALLKAGDASGDRLWQLPLWDEYQELIDTPFADVANLGAGDEAKSIAAGCFLARFAKDYAWAHLDIAGTAWVGPGKRRMATGRPVAALVDYLLTQVA